MTITETQRKHVYDVVWAKAEHKETFDEVYDHLLTALDHHPQTAGDFESVFAQIIKNDFGCISNVDFKMVRVTRRQMWLQFLQHLRSYFKAPLIMLTIIAAVSSMYAAEYIPRNFIYVTLIVSTAAPVAVIAIRSLKKGEFYPTTGVSIGILIYFGFNTSYSFYKTTSYMCTIFMLVMILLKVTFNKKFIKSSVKDRVIADLSSIGVGILCIFLMLPMVVLDDQQFEYVRQAHTGMVTIMLTCYIVYCMSFIKLYQNELRKQVLL